MIDGTQVPEAFLLPQPPKIDRTAIAAAMKRGETVPGAAFELGNPFIAVRTK
ncbi:MAG: siphovirus Gp157 family protein [Alphaproteobacteria bacterium]|nr:siphovirus Gp157 family protein [Alphaproteobacteria bacterium]